MSLVVRRKEEGGGLLDEVGFVWGLSLGVLGLEDVKVDFEGVTPTFKTARGAEAVDAVLRASGEVDVARVDRFLIADVDLARLPLVGWVESREGAVVALGEVIEVLGDALGAVLPLVPLPVLVSEIILVRVDVAGDVPEGTRDRVEVVGDFAPAGAFALVVLMVEGLEDLLIVMVLVDVGDLAGLGIREWSVLDLGKCDLVATAVAAAAGDEGL